MHRKLVIVIAACGLLLVILGLGYYIINPLWSRSTISAAEYSTLLTSNGSVTFKPHAWLLGSVFLRVDSELVFDCIYNEQDPVRGVFSVNSLAELTETELQWNFIFNESEVNYVDQYNVDRTDECLFASRKSYIPFDSPYLRRFPKMKRFPIIDSARASSRSCALVYIPYMDIDNGDSWMEKEEAVIEAWIGDKHIKIDTEYPSPESRSDGRHGIGSASEIYLLNASIAVVIRDSDHYRIVHSDCDTTTTTVLIITLKDGKIVENRKIKMMCDDGVSIYVAYIDDDRSISTEGTNYVVVKNTIDGIQSNQPWDDVIRFHCVRQDPSMEWFDNCLVVLDDYEVSVFTVQ